MTDSSRTNQELITENHILDQRIQKLEQSESKCKWAEQVLKGKAEKKGNQIPKALEVLVPEIYMPRLQLFIRILLATMTLIYFNYIPIPQLILTITQINLIIVSYYAFHVFWWWHYQKYGAKIVMIRLGSWIDIMGAVNGLGDRPYSSSLPNMIL